MSQGPDQRPPVDPGHRQDPYRRSSAPSDERLPLSPGSPPPGPPAPGPPPPPPGYGASPPPPQYPTPQYVDPRYPAAQYVDPRYPAPQPPGQGYGPPPTPGPHPGRPTGDAPGGFPLPPRRSRAGLVAAAVAVATAVALTVGGVVVFRSLTGGSATEAAELGEAEFADVQTDVPLDKRFTLPFSYDLTAVPTDEGSATAEDVVGVYLDPLLSVEAPDALVEVEGSTFVVGPRPEGQTWTTAAGSVPMSAPGQWGFSGRYYIAERLDRETGEPLAQPRVTAFTIRSAVPTTPVSFTVDQDGVGHFTWEPVEGARGYLVVALEHSAPDPFTAEPDVIGETRETRWSTVEQDEFVQEGLEDDGPYGLGVSMQNDEFVTFRWSEDELRDPGMVAEDNASNPKAYGVVALTGEGASPFSMVPTPEISAKLPHAIAYNAAREITARGIDVTSVEALPGQMPVTMADGSTVMRSVIYHPDALVQSSGGSFRLPYTVEGTLFTGGYSLFVAGDLASVQERVLVQTRTILEQRPKTGTEQPYTYTAAVVDLDDVEVSTTAPQVPYPVNGTNALTTYLAANLIAGKEYVDLSAYLVPGSRVTASGVELYDALDEALAQNPFALGTIEIGFVESRQVLTVRYTGFESLEARQAEQVELAAEVDRVTAAIITDAMTAEAKARAINDHLVATAEYDYPALSAKGTGDYAQFPRAWTASGVLLSKTGVCASYANAYKALADAAGLEAVVVTGTVTSSGNGHAWNKVNLDGTWRMVDATWNDSTPPDGFLLLTDAQAEQTRSEDADWVVDSRIGQYAAS